MIVYVCDADRVGALEAWTEDAAFICGYEKPKVDVKVPRLPKGVRSDSQFVKTMISKCVARMKKYKERGVPLNIVVRCREGEFRELLVGAIWKAGLRPVNMVTESRFLPMGWRECFVRYEEIGTKAARAKSRMKRKPKKGAKRAQKKGLKK